MALHAIGASGSIEGAATALGTADQVAYYTAANTLGGSANLRFINGNELSVRVSVTVSNDGTNKKAAMIDDGSTGLLKVVQTGIIGFTASSTSATGAADLAFSRVGVGVGAIGTGASGSVVGSLNLANVDSGAVQDLTMKWNGTKVLAVQESGFAASGGAAIKARLISADSTLTTGDFSVMCSTATAGITITLPTAPRPNQIVNVKKISRDPNRLIIDGNGFLIDGLTTSSTISQNNPNVQLQFTSGYGSTNIWNIL